MPKLIRSLLDRAAHPRHAYTPSFFPARGDQVEAWLKRQRDEWNAQHDTQWDVVDDLLDLYRLHADTGTPLDQHCCEGGNVDDCAGCYDAKEEPPQPAYCCGNPEDHAHPEEATRA